MTEGKRVSKLAKCNVKKVFLAKCNPKSFLRNVRTLYRQPTIEISNISIDVFNSLHGSTPLYGQANNDLCTSMIQIYM
jgi:hypothetical protein